jgi:8-oxo-dGTP pyrophosphatase MutT (NUDIX family)
MLGLQPDGWRVRSLILWRQPAQSYILLIRRAAGQKLSGFLEPPGGKFLASDHNLRSAADRENLEELGTPTNRLSMVRFHPLRHEDEEYGCDIAAFVLLADPTFREELDRCFTPNTEAARCSWYRIDKLPKKKLTPQTLYTALGEPMRESIIQYLKTTSP